VTLIYAETMGSFKPGLPLPGIVTSVMEAEDANENNDDERVEGEGAAGKAQMEHKELDKSDSLLMAVSVCKFRTS